MNKFSFSSKLIILSLTCFFSLQTIAQIKFQTGDGSEGSSSSVIIGTIIVGIIIGVGIGYFLFGRKK